MKWYEFQDDLGDGTTCARRFRTREEAQRVRDWLETQPHFQCDGDGSPVIEVDTDTDYFFDTAEQMIEEDV